MTEIRPLARLRHGKAPRGPREGDWSRKATRDYGLAEDFAVVSLARRRLEKVLARSCETTIHL